MKKKPEVWLIGEDKMMYDAVLSYSSKEAKDLLYEMGALSTKKVRARKLPRTEYKKITIARYEYSNSYEKLNVLIERVLKSKKPLPQCLYYVE